MALAKDSIPTQFEAFSCYVFDEELPMSTSWLRADVNIKCGTEAHSQVKFLGLAAILIYPVGLILCYGFLLARARFEIAWYHHDRLNLKHVAHRPTPRADVIRFLHAEYDSRFSAWGVCHPRNSLLARRTTLTAGVAHCFLSLPLLVLFATCAQNS